MREGINFANKELYSNQMVTDGKTISGEGLCHYFILCCQKELQVKYSVKIDTGVWQFWNSKYTHPV